MKLWEQYKDWKESCEWVELSREVSPETIHWDGFPTMSMPTIYDFDTTIFCVHEYKMVGQYGTHVDAPIHFVPNARTLESFTPDDMVLPLCVIDKTAAVEADNDYCLTAEDIKEWEAINGKIPEGAFVAFRSDWSKRKTQEEIENKDSEGNKHYPGWGMDALKFLVEERNVKAIGHEPVDTDSPKISGTLGYIGEEYILKQDRYQIELLINLDKCPATGSIIFCTFPKVKGGSGFTARCFALCEK